MSSASWPGVSVVIPVLNEERHLAAAVRRVLEQAYPGELELILAVGPSQDRTHEIADALAAADPRIRVVDNPAGRTPHALNLGVAAAAHDIVVRVDGHGELLGEQARRPEPRADEPVPAGGPPASTHFTPLKPSTTKSSARSSSAWKSTSFRMSITVGCSRPVSVKVLSCFGSQPI